MFKIIILRKLSSGAMITPRKILSRMGESRPDFGGLNY